MLLTNILGKCLSGCPIGRAADVAADATASAIVRALGILPLCALAVKPFIKSLAPVNERADAGFQTLLSIVGLSACKINCLAKS